MASKDKLSSVHNNICLLSGVGAVSTVLGMSSYFLSSDIVTKKTKQAMKYVGIVFYILGVIIIALSISLYRNEREELGRDITTQLYQVREKDNGPDWNEPALMASLSAAIILIGSYLTMREYEKNKDIKLMGPALFALGWFAQAYVASTRTKSLDSAHGHRLAWNLPGAATIVTGSFMLLWQHKNNFHSGPGWPITILGFVFLTIGNSVAPEPTFRE